MQIWAGLGNPGSAYALHRHNIGFMAVDVIAQIHGFSPWKQRFRGLSCEGRIGPSSNGAKILLLKPQTFMNESGRSIRAAVDFFKLDASAVTCFYDELDLEPFKLKVKTGGGAAGHNGIRSTMAHIGPDFRRVRLGIGHPGHKDRVTGHVLGNFAKDELDSLSDLLGAIAAEARWLSAGDDVRFMNDVAVRINARVAE
jgi:PTH1 family peptidyl-tRNA hydrolase